MADEVAINGADDQMPDDFHDAENDSKVNELIQKLKSLEIEKSELVRDNGESKERISSLVAEIESLQSEDVAMREKIERMDGEIEMATDGKRALETIMQRAMELETELFRLQHDLVAAGDEADQANKEVAELELVVEEKSKRVEALETEVENLKTAKAESEMRIRDLERKIGVLEVKESEGNSEKVRVEIELREKIGEREKEIAELKDKVETLESVIKREALELEKWKKVKSRVDEELRASEKKVEEMGSKVSELEGDLGDAEKIIGELKEKVVNGSASGSREIVDNGEDKLQWPLVVAGSTGAIALVAAMAYICYARHARN